MNLLLLQVKKAHKQNKFAQYNLSFVSQYLAGLLLSPIIYIITRLHPIFWNPTLALKPTIYKFRVNLADTNRNQYSDINLTVAKHPSENQVRMMVRLLAFCLNSTEHLTFTKGLSDQDEPDIWELSDIGDILTWIDVGEPSSDRIKKATRKSKHTHIYTFNENKSDVWFGKNQAALRQLNVSITQLDFAPIEALTHALQRTNDLSLMISGHSLFVTLGEVNEEVTLTELQTQE